MDTASHSETESEFSSDSEDERVPAPVTSRNGPRNDLEVKPTSDHSDQLSTSSSLSSSKRSHPSNDEKVRNSRNTIQEKENRGTQNILEQEDKQLTWTQLEDCRKEEEITKTLAFSNSSNMKANLVTLPSNWKKTFDRPRSCSSPSALTSDGDDTSSGGQEVRRIISNDAVARRHQANLARQQLNKEREKQQLVKERPR